MEFDNCRPSDLLKNVKVSYTHNGNGVLTHKTLKYAYFYLIFAMNELIILFIILTFAVFLIRLKYNKDDTFKLLGVVFSTMLIAVVLSDNTIIGDEKIILLVTGFVFFLFSVSNLLSNK